MRTVAFVTCEERPGLAPDDVAAAAALGERGVQVVAAPWSLPERWERFDAIVLRSTWDYHLRHAEFLRWVAQRERLWNPPHVVQWNATKRYLLHLAEAGIPCVPTRLGSPDPEWEEFVVKPLVSASAHQTFRVRRGSPLPAADQDVLVQPFLPEIQSEGEWSLIFFGGAFSHAVRKFPAAGDFRVQEEHGGRTVAAEPPPWLAAAAERARRAAPGETLYARVDGVIREGTFLLMELELIEPGLHFAQAPAAAAAFAGAVLRIC